jgi:hypothetical protein
MTYNASERTFRLPQTTSFCLSTFLITCCRTQQLQCKCATHNGLATAFSISSDFWLQPFVINQWHLYFHLQNCERTFQIYIILAGMIIVKKKRPKQTDDLFHASEKLSFLMTFLRSICLRGCSCVLIKTQSAAVW